MKKLVSIFLAIVMILAISVPVFAAEDTTLTINGEAGRKYDGYQLLDLTTSLKLLLPMPAYILFRYHLPIQIYLYNQ